MSNLDCSILDMLFYGDKDDKKAFIYQLKKPCDILNIMIKDSGNCWDVIAYNRFFYDYDSEDELDIYNEILIR